MAYHSVSIHPAELRAAALVWLEQQLRYESWLERLAASARGGRAGLAAAA